MALLPQERELLARLAVSPDAWVPFAELFMTLASSIPDLDEEVRELAEHGYVKFRGTGLGIEAVKLTRAGYQVFQAEPNTLAQTIHVNAGNVQIGSGNAQHLPPSPAPPTTQVVPTLDSTMPGLWDSLVLSHEPPYLGIRIQAVASTHTIEPFDEAACQAFKAACNQATGWGSAVAKTIAVELTKFDRMNLWWRFSYTGLFEFLTTSAWLRAVNFMPTQLPFKCHTLAETRGLLANLLERLGPLYHNQFTPENLLVQVVFGASLPTTVPVYSNVHVALAANGLLSRQWVEGVLTEDLSISQRCTLADVLESESRAKFLDRFMRAIRLTWGIE